MSPITLAHYLSNLRHQGKALSWDTLKKLSVAELQEVYGNKYSQPWQLVKIDLQERPFSEIHQAILESSNKAAAATSLGSYSLDLTNYLGNLRHQGKALSWDTLKKLSVAELQKVYDDKYSQPWQPVKIDLQKHPFSEIHQTILESSSRAEAATRLGVCPRVLARYLSNLQHQGNALAWETLQKLSVAELQEVYGDKYNQPWPAEKIDLQEHPFSEIHQTILESSSKTAAATRLGVDPETLTCYLGNLRHQGNALSWGALKKLSVEELQEVYGDKYSQPWPAEKIDLQENPVLTLPSNKTNLYQFFGETALQSEKSTKRLKTPTPKQ